MTNSHGIVVNYSLTDAEKEKEKKDEKRRVLLIACAGSHQIWALFLDNTIWWKYKSHTEGMYRFFTAFTK